ncbi:hypothetical protein [Thiomicrospira microaerophila]|uniref:hypothetical protein n=1 Tax=Thiomicrospira microaerophila TaxID=406020 RepID=UPI0012FDD782|nr:hypothetical protein [Thiomicrospira microaerophila]
MNPTMIRELAKSIRQAFEHHQAIKMPVMRKAEFSSLLHEIRMSETMLSYVARQR